MQMQHNGLDQVRNGLVNYIGAMVKLTEGQQVVSILTEEALKLSQVDGPICDMTIVSPVFRAVIFILKQRCYHMKQLSVTNVSAIKEYEGLITELENLIKKFEVS